MEAVIRRRPVVGRSTIRRSAALEQPVASHQDEDFSPDFVIYSDEVKIESTDSSFATCVDIISNQERGCGRKFQPVKFSSDVWTRQVLTKTVVKEHNVARSDINKVFCSQWLSNRQVIFGSKCNKLMVMDINSKTLHQIPTLKSSSKSSMAEDQDGGLRSIAINPSRTLLATNARSSKETAVYRLPTLDPICVGENGHNDWIFDQVWLDDQFLVSGSRDGSVTLWRIEESLFEPESRDNIMPSHHMVNPLQRKICKQAEKVRSICYNQSAHELAVVSSGYGGYIHCWDAVTMRQVMSKKLPFTLENVCLTANEECQIYAVGSRANTDLLDSRTLQSVRSIKSQKLGYGVRSVSFNGNILTIGTGLGQILFWDLRASDFLESAMLPGRRVQLNASSCDAHEEPVSPFEEETYVPAIYTHCYDKSGTKLFAGGGPLQRDISGSYIAIWQ